MASFKKILLTDKGRDLNAREIAGTTQLIFTKVSASNEVIPDSANVATLIGLNGVKQTVSVSRVEKIGTAQVKVTATFNNSGLMNGYSMETLGLYAKDSAGVEILYSVAVAQVADYMPATNGKNLSTVTVELIINISNTENISMEVDVSALVTTGVLKSMHATESDRGIAKIYSETEAETDSEKVKSVVEAGNGDEREFLGEDPGSGAVYGDSYWEKLIKVLDHTKILTVKGLVKILRKIIKPATDNQYGLTTNNNIKNLITTHAPTPDLTPYVPFSKGYRAKDSTTEFVRTNGRVTWVSDSLEMYNGDNNQFTGAFSTNAHHAFYKTPNRNGGNWNRILDEHDLLDVTLRNQWRVMFDGAFGVQGGVVATLPNDWSDCLVYYRAYPAAGDQSSLLITSSEKGGRNMVLYAGGGNFEIKINVNVTNQVVLVDRYGDAVINKVLYKNNIIR